MSRKKYNIVKFSYENVHTYLKFIIEGNSKCHHFFQSCIKNSGKNCNFDVTIES